MTRPWSNPRHPAWPWVGGAVILGSLVATLGFFLQRPQPIEAGTGTAPFQGRGMGRYGRIIERLDRSTFTLHYDTIRGEEKALALEGIRGVVEEEEIHWVLNCPQATRESGIWLLHGPLAVEAKEAASGRVVGRGRMAGSGPVLQWAHGVWQGLSPMDWEDLEGQGQGHWSMPAGWRRGLDRRFVVARGPVLWKGEGEGTLRTLQAERMSVLLGLDEAELEGVTSGLEGGEIETAKVTLDAQAVHWAPPIRFHRADGWIGNASSGYAPRPPEGQAVTQLELRDLAARKVVQGGEERLRAGGARWTPEGLRLEGDVTWSMPLKDQEGHLRAPRLVFRTAEGGQDLPPDLPLGDARAEGTAVLTWGVRSLSSPCLEARRSDRSWVVHAPSYGRAEQGTFSAGRGQGRPGSWTFQGPVSAQLFRGGTIRGGTLEWTDAQWTLAGRPVTYSAATERLSGPRVIGTRELVQFPEGVSGAMRSGEQDLNLRADQGVRSAASVVLKGRVGLTGRGWRLDADEVVLVMGVGQEVERIEAIGHVSLTGSQGEGQGRRLILDPSTRRAVWEGKVRGMAEVKQ